MSNQINIALVGNPNTGKTSVFNQLTGLKQKVGNYPGITVEKKEGICQLPNGLKAYITDLPGTYSLNVTSADEQIVLKELISREKNRTFDLIVVIADIENLKRNLFLFTQIKDLGMPAILAINMADIQQQKGIEINIALIKKELKAEVVLISARKNVGITKLKRTIQNYKNIATFACCNTKAIDEHFFNELQKKHPKKNPYCLWLIYTQKILNNVELPSNYTIDDFPNRNLNKIKMMQQKETILRHQYINKIINRTYKKNITIYDNLKRTLDRLLTHPFLGYLIFFLIMLLVFQAIYSWSSYPMDYIDTLFAKLSSWLHNNLPTGALSNLLTEGIIPGLGGIAIFIPQIAILFLFISILEESGYMSRVVFIMDRFMRRFGLNGKSIVPLISGTACAIPAIMASRTIQNKKERLITILVTPFITCSARLPVYLIIISIVIPNQHFLGLNLQAITLMALYILGFVTAISAAYILNKILTIKSQSFFIIEMPGYRLPSLKNVTYTVIEKTKDFIVNAGKIILTISIILWFLASHGPSSQFNNAEEIVQNQELTEQLSPDELNSKIASYKLSHSYIGIIGQAIEPAIKPLGYDWKIGIALVTSFAAREIFVGSLATIYSIGTDDEETIKNRLANEKNNLTGEKTFNLPMGISLLLFYAFAMQCMSTLAIVKRETNSWKWPLLQLLFMTAIAYISALSAYQILK